MKNILLYTDTEIIGGSELQIFLLAKFLDKTKFTPIIACSHKKTLDKWAEKFHKENIKVIRIAAKHKHDPRHFRELKKIIKSEKIDILHLHVWNPASSRYGFLAGKWTKTPIIITEHDPFKISTLKDIFKKFSLKQTKKIITVSKQNQGLIEELYPTHQHKTSVIHNGIDLNWWKSQLIGFRDSDRKEIKEKLFQANEDTLIIITIAAMHMRKGINYLIDSIPAVISKYPNVKFVLVGDGPDLQKFKKQAEQLNCSQNIIFLGKQKNIPYILKSSDIFVLPSIREAFGFVNLEAMICGLPVIATTVGGIPEIIENNKNGILIPSKQSAKISQSINQLIDNPTIRNHLASAGFQTVTEKFDAKKMAQSYQKHYLEINS